MTMTTSQRPASSIAAAWRCFVGLHTDQCDQVLHSAGGLCGLRRNPDARMVGERRDIGLVQHDVEVGQVFGHAADFDVVTLADDDRVISIADEGGDRLVGDVHQRAGGLDNFQAERADLTQLPL